MPLKDILVFINKLDDVAREAAAAIAFARSHDAHLSGLCLIPLVKTSDPQEQQNHYAEIERADTAGREFKAATEKADVNADWITASGDFSSPANISRAFNHYARLADLTIIRRRNGIAAGRYQDNFLESVVMGSGRPVLMIPDNKNTQPIGLHILVAWDYSKEAARAIHDALPLLHKAKSVEIVTVGLVTAPAKGEDVPGRALCNHLIRHGIVANASKTRARAPSIGDSILESAEANNADLIVLGAFGRPTSGELLLSDVTGTVLENTKIPIFLSH